MSKFLDSVEKQINEETKEMQLDSLGVALQKVMLQKEKDAELKAAKLRRDQAQTEMIQNRSILDLPFSRFISIDSPKPKREYLHKAGTFGSSLPQPTPLQMRPKFMAYVVHHALKVMEQEARTLNKTVQTAS